MQTKTKSIIGAVVLASGVAGTVLLTHEKEPVKPLTTTAVQIPQDSTNHVRTVYPPRGNTIANPQ